MQLSKAEIDHFMKFGEWVVSSYKGGHNASWWGLIQANTNSSTEGLQQFFELMRKFRQNK